MLLSCGDIFLVMMHGRCTSGRGVERVTEDGWIGGSWKEEMHGN